MPNLLSFLGEVTLRSSLVLAATFLLLLTMRRASASERHLVLFFGLLIVALVPMGLLLSPKISWTIPFPSYAKTDAVGQKVTAQLTEEPQAPLPSISAPFAENKPSVLDAFTLQNCVAVLFAGGMARQLVLLGQAAWSWRKIRRQYVKAHLPVETLEQAQAFAGTKAVPPVFASHHITVPLLAGWLRPEIILPAEAHQWPQDRLLMVLCHELAHFKRGDSILLPLICVLRVLYWWHPLVWLALGRLLRERENACDDLVLNQDFRASDYADLIVRTARQARVRRWQMGALAMATPSHLGKRIQAILNPAINRRPANRTTILVGTVLALAFGWFFVATEIRGDDKPLASYTSATADSAKAKVEIGCTLVDVSEKVYSREKEKIEMALAENNMSFFNNHEGISVLSTPRVTVPDGEQMSIDLTKDFSYQTGFDWKNGKIIPSPIQTHTRKVGPQIEGRPTVSADGRHVELTFNCEVTSFDGWIDDPPYGKQPIFNVRRISTQRLMGDHDYVWVGNEASQSPAENDKAFHHMALLIYPHIVKKTQAETGFKALPSLTTISEAPKPPLIYVSLHMIEIDEKTYEKQPAVIDDAVKNGDMSFLQKSGGLRVLSNPAVYVTNGIKATITNEKELLRGDKSTPVTVLTAQATADANGKITRTVVPTQTMGPSKIPLGINFEVTPSLAPDGTISLPMRFSLGEVTDYKKGDDYVTRASVTDKQLIATDGKPYGFWLGDQHVYSLFDVMQLPDNPIKTLPVLSASPNRVALIVTAKQVAQN